MIPISIDRAWMPEPLWRMPFRPTRPAVGRRHHHPATSCPATLMHPPLELQRGTARIAHCTRNSAYFVAFCHAWRQKNLSSPVSSGEESTSASCATHRSSSATASPRTRPECTTQSVELRLLFSPRVRASKRPPVSRETDGKLRCRGMPSRLISLRCEAQELCIYTLYAHRR